MERVPKVGDIDNEDNILTTKIKLTKNEYNATIRNKLETNRLKVINRHLSSQNDLTACKLRTSIHDLKKWLAENQKVVCNIDEFFMNRRLQSAASHYPSRLPGVHSSLSRTRNIPRNLAKSASTLSRPYTAPLQQITEQVNELESDDEIMPISMSRLASSKYSIERAPSAISSSTLSHHHFEINLNNDESISPPPVIGSSSTRITWPVKLKVFALQDESEARKQFLAWRAEQRKSKVRRPSKMFYDSELDRKYKESIRRREEIEAYVTPELIQEHKFEDPIFAKRYKQLKLAVRSGKVPSYDPNDREINVNMTKSKIERARSALITAKQSKIKTYYRNQQYINDTQLSKRVEIFLKRLEQLKNEK